MFCYILHKYNTNAQCLIITMEIVYKYVIKFILEETYIFLFICNFEPIK